MMMMVMIPFKNPGKIRLRKVSDFVEGHTADKLYIMNSNPDQAHTPTAYYRSWHVVGTH